MNQAQLAINSVTTTLTAGNFAEALVAYHDAGFTQLEMQFGQLKTWLADGHTVSEAKSILDDNGLTFLGGFEIALEVFSSPESLAQNLEAQVANAMLIDALGGGMLVFGTDGPEGTVVTLETLAAVADRVRTLLDATRHLNVQIGLEFNWGPVLKSLATTKRLCELIDDERVSIVFDTAHYHCTVTKFEDLTLETVRWIGLVHLNDMRDIPGDLSNCNSDRVLLGEGILDIRAILDRLDAGGYTGAYSIELFNDDIWKLTPTDAAPKLYENLRSYVS